MKLLLKNEGDKPLLITHKDPFTQQEVVVVVEPNGFAHVEQEALRKATLTEQE